jgi:hypothetical protein
MQDGTFDQPIMNRRDILKRAGGGFASLGLAGVLADQGLLAAESPLVPKSPHIQPRAKRIILRLIPLTLSRLSRNIMGSARRELNVKQKDKPEDFSNPLSSLSNRGSLGFRSAKSFLRSLSVSMISA